MTKYARTSACICALMLGPFASAQEVTIDFDGVPVENIPSLTFYSTPYYEDGFVIRTFDAGASACSEVPMAFVSPLYPSYTGTPATHFPGDASCGAHFVELARADGRPFDLLSVDMQCCANDANSGGGVNFEALAPDGTVATQSFATDGPLTTYKLNAAFSNIVSVRWAGGQYQAVYTQFDNFRVVPHRQRTGFLAPSGYDANGNAELVVSMRDPGSRANEINIVNVPSSVNVATYELPEPSRAVVQLVMLDDLTSGGARETAVLAVGADPWNSKVFVRSGEDGSPIKNVTFFDQSWQAVDAAGLRDPGSGLVEDLAVLATNITTGEIAVQIRDALAGTFVRNVFFLNSDWTPLQMQVLNEEIDTNPGPEIAVLAVSSAGQIAVMIKDAATNNFIGNLFFLNDNWEPLQAVVIPDRNGNLADEVGLVAKNIETGKLVIMVRDALTNEFLNNVFPFGTGWTPLEVAVLPDETANGAAELATLAVNDATGKLVIQVRDSQTGQFLRNLPVLGSNWDAQDLAAIMDVGDGTRGLAVLAERRDGRIQVVQTIEAMSGGLVSNVFIQPTNLAPIADAGSDREVLVGDVVVLDASGSSDPNADSLVYQWSLSARPAGSTAELLNPNDVNASFVPDVDGLYVVELVVDDSRLASEPAQVTLDAYTPQIGVPFVARNGLTVTLTQFTAQDLGNGYIRYTATYLQENTTTVAIDEGSLKLYFSNAEPLSQYGFFGQILPGPEFSVTRSYQFDVLSTAEPLLLQYDHEHFFAPSPVPEAIHWVFPIR